MIMPSILTIPIEITINERFKFSKEIELGIIKDSKITKDKVIIKVKINSKKKKQFIQLLKILREL